MQTPFIVKSNLTDVEIENFNKRFSISNGFDCSIRENVWRRHQVKENQQFSRWQSEKDTRRRLIHFRDKYAIINNDFCLTESYLFVNMQLPNKEISDYEKLFSQLNATVQVFDNHPEDLLQNRYCAKGYSNVDITISNKEQDVEIKNKPWQIFKTGIRQKANRGNPTIIFKHQLRNFFPAHIEMGCGPSIEAGVPPLNYFHKLFCLTNKNFFVFKKEDDNLIESLIDQDAWLKKTTYMQSCCLTASPTKFYNQLANMVRSGEIIEPIFNNNFDGIIKTLDINELCLRQFDSTGIYPEYEFSKDAKSLIVIGSHADRRGCQASARKQGLKIVYVDPEGYETNQQFVEYPLEAPQTEDFVLRLNARDVWNKLC